MLNQLIRVCVLLLHIGVQVCLSTRTRWIWIETRLCWGGGESSLGTGDTAVTTLRLWWWLDGRRMVNKSRECWPGDAQQTQNYVKHFFFELHFTTLTWSGNIYRCNRQIKMRLIFFCSNSTFHLSHQAHIFSYIIVCAPLCVLWWFCNSCGIAHVSWAARL